MKHFEFDVHWDQIKGQLKQRYGQLTDDDLTFAEGKGEEMLGRLRQTLGVSEEELTDTLNELHAQVGGRAEQLKSRVAGMAHDARARAGEIAEDLKHRASEVGEEARAQAAAAYGQARQKVRTLREDGEDYVRHNPRESLVAALFAGFVAGLLIRR